MRGGLGFLLMNAILFFAGIGFTLVVFELNSISFVLEFVALLVLIFLLAFGMFLAYNERRFGWTVITITLFTLLLDAALVTVFSRSFGIKHIVTIFFSLAGIGIAFLNLGIGEEHYEEPDFSKPEHYYDYIDKMESK
jgi:hypothetical protein